MKQISIIIPAYNSESTIEDCVHSINIQTQKPAFVLVVDDCSTDHTDKIVRSLGISVKNNLKRIGKAASINSALDLITTDYVLILDSDTYLEREFIRKLSKILDSHDYDGGSGMVKYVGRNEFSKKIAKKWRNRTWEYNGCCQFFKTEVIKKLRFDEFTYVEDEEIYQRMKDMNVKMVDAWVSTEVTTSKEKYFNQRLRWLLGDIQLTAKKRDLVELASITVIAFAPIILFSLIFYYIKSDLSQSFLSLGFLFLFGFAAGGKDAPFDIKDIIRGIFIYPIAFIQIIVLRLNLNLDENWKR
jgi:cellulose synthase/poly-beta-1,6-N-acetylglucosamine synthase-like glycosyltransferase